MVGAWVLEFIGVWLLMIGYYNVRRIHETTGFDSDGK